MNNRCMYTPNVPTRSPGSCNRPMSVPGHHHPEACRLHASCPAADTNLNRHDSCEHTSASHERPVCPTAKPSRACLLQRINEASFAVDDILLYLDTHPCDQEALAFYKENIKIRKQAMQEYAECYGPLTIDTANDAQSDSWEWVTQPWPWEGGNC